MKMIVKHEILLLIISTFLVACVNVTESVTGNHSVYLGDGRSNPSVRIAHVSYQQAYPEIVMYTMSLLGMPYTYGGSSRNSGFDCSGLVLNVYQNTVHISLPRTAREMANAGIPISKNQLKIGDLVFFNTTGQKYSHVGIYLGHDRFVHAPNVRSYVQIGYLNSPYWRKKFTGARTYFVK
ncbi:MAG: peptidoglycan endopeptidase [Neisseriaceae bacterium]|nr:MAG: peptidoglycan endopeptidase [Neisseriaceae bacterium]